MTIAIKKEKVLKNHVKKVVKVIKAIPLPKKIKAKIIAKEQKNRKKSSSIKEKDT